MAKIAVLERKCTGCGLCQKTCPFGAIDMKDGRPEFNAACRVCGLCVKTCPQQAIVKLETRTNTVDKSQWRDILVFAEVSSGRLHPVCMELIGKARELAAGIDRFLDTLSYEDRFLFMRRYWYADSLPDAARMAGMRYGTAAVRLHRVKEKLKQHLQKEGLLV